MDFGRQIFNAAYTELMECITVEARREIAPMLCFVWGGRAPLIASMIVARPEVAGRLALAPTRAIHAVAAYVQSADAAGATAVEIATSVLERHARDLLAEAVPGVHARLYRALDKIGARTRDLSFYTTFNEALHSPAAPLVLSMGMVSTGQLTLAGTIAADPVLVAAIGATDLDQRSVAMLRSALSFLRTMGLANEIERLPPGSGWRAISRRIAADLGKARCVAPPWSIPVGWRIVGNLADLWQIGRRMENCLSCLSAGDASHFREFVEGRAVFLVSVEEPTSIASVRRAGPTMWSVGQVQQLGGDPGSRGRVQSELETALTTAMAMSGHVLLDTDPFAAMIHISWQTRVKALRETGDGDADREQAGVSVSP